MKIIHLSDFHLDGDTLNFNHKKLFEALLFDLIDYLDKDTILIFSGDFLNMGGKNIKNKDYFDVFSKVFFKGIYDLLPELKNKTFFVAGNHDIERELIKRSDMSVKKDLLTDINSRKEIYEELKEKGLVGFDKYNRFVNNFYENFKGEKKISSIESNFIISIDNGDKIGITSLNSSFLCYDDNDFGNILLLEKQLSNSLEFIDECNIKVAILHHPISFFHKTEMEFIQKTLEKEYDLVFIGHTHKEEQKFIKSLNGNCFFSIGKSLSGVLSKEIDYTNGYSIIEYIPNLKIIVHSRKYNDHSNKFISNSDYGNENGIYEISINKNIDNIKATTLEISDEFKKYLNDVGVNLTHKNRQKIILDDIFIYPNLEVYNISSTSEEEKNFLNSETLLDELNSSEVNRIVILGETSSGKTSLCKKAFERIFNKIDFFPILINGNDIKKTDLKTLEKLKNNLLNEQYKSSKIPPKKNPFFIIDDFNNSKIEPTFKKNFIKSLIESNFSFILIWDDFFTFNDICDSLISKMDIYEIMHIGIKDRFELIKKWAELNDFNNEKEKFLFLNGTEKLINQIVGKNLVPAYSFYILVILQSMELSSKENFEQSTLGHYYDVLIKTALSKNSSSSNQDIERFYSYLSELSYYFHKNNIRAISENSLMDFHKNFINNYSIVNSFITTIDKLLHSNIIYKANDEYKFRYNYIFYYFLGKYFADNIDEEDIKRQVIYIADTLYNTDSANTYLFLSHHTKSKFIIETILKVAQNLFSQEKVMNFSDDISEINRLVIETSQNLVLDISKSPEENKITELEQFDKEMVDDKENDYNEINYISEINKSFRTIDILGLILKNRYASLKTFDKEKIAQELYFLGLRTTSSIFNLLLEGEHTLREDLIEIIGSDKSFTKNEKEQLAKKIIFNLYYMTAYTIIKRISNSVATKDLELTFNSIKEKMINNYAVQLIDISNRFEYSSNFPFEETDRLKKLFKNNKFSFFLLRRFAYNYLRMFPMIDSDRQKVCDKLGIPINQQRLAQITSKTLKK